MRHSCFFVLSREQTERCTDCLEEACSFCWRKSTTRALEANFFSVILSFSMDLTCKQIHITSYLQVYLSQVIYLYLSPTGYLQVHLILVLSSHFTSTSYLQTLHSKIIYFHFTSKRYLHVHLSVITYLQQFQWITWLIPWQQGRHPSEWLGRIRHYCDRTLGPLPGSEIQTQGIHKMSYV